MNRSRKRIVSRATAMTGSVPWADHSCAKREGKSFYSIMGRPDAAPSATGRLGGSVDGGVGRDADAIVGGRRVLDRNGVAARDGVQDVVAGAAVPGEPDQRVAALGTADEEAQAALLREGVA